MIPIGDSVPIRCWPVVTWGLITINALVFFHELSLGPALEPFLRTWGFVPADYFLLGQTAPEAWVEVTCRSSRCFSTEAGPRSAT